MRRTENRVSERLTTSTDRAQIILVPDNSTLSSPIRQPAVSVDSEVWKVAYDADKELQKQIFDVDGNFLHEIYARNCYFWKGEVILVPETLVNQVIARL